MMRLRLLVLPLLLAVAAGGGALFYLQSKGATPRALAPYLEKRASGHNPFIEGAGRAAATTLLQLDRGDPVAFTPPPLVLGAQPAGAPARSGKLREVASSEEARRAFATAAPGDIITFLPGDYAIRGKLHASRAGSPDAPIVVRASRPGTVRIAFEAAEGFVVTAPHWEFENLDIRGACRRDSCEHAFHVVGGAHHFVARNNTLRDFHAHIKINGARGQFPDFGLIEANTLTNAAPRRTAGPVTPVDLVAASDWVIRANLVQDFVKGGGNGFSYGIFAKGGAERTLIERNLVLCEARLKGQPGQRVGISFGGGGTGKRYCRDGRCITEHDGGILRANLVAGCSDVGIYLNSAANTRIVDNTLLDTAGVQVRFPASSATLEGNLVDGPIRTDDGGTVRLGENLATPIWQLYLGRHPQRGLFADPARLDLRWRDDPPRRSAATGSVDLCGVQRGAQAGYGAFGDFRACLRAGAVE